MDRTERASLERALSNDERATTLINRAQLNALTKVAAAEYMSLAALLRRCIMLAMPEIFPDWDELYDAELKATQERNR